MNTLDLEGLLIEELSRNAKLVWARKIGRMCNQGLIEDSRITQVLNACSLKVRSAFFKSFRGFLPDVEFSYREIRTMSRMYCRNPGNPKAFVEKHGILHLHWPELGQSHPEFGAQIFGQRLDQIKVPIGEGELVRKSRELMRPDFLVFVRALVKSYPEKWFPDLRPVIDQFFCVSLCGEDPRVALLFLVNYQNWVCFPSPKDNLSCPEIFRLLGTFCSAQIGGSGCVYKFIRLYKKYSTETQGRFYDLVHQFFQRVDLHMMGRGNEILEMKVHLDNFFKYPGVTVMKGVSRKRRKRKQYHFQTFWYGLLSIGGLHGVLRRELIRDWNARIGKHQPSLAPESGEKSTRPQFYLSGKNRRRLGYLLGDLTFDDFVLALSWASVNRVAYEYFMDDVLKLAYFESTFWCPLEFQVFLVHLYPEVPDLRIQAFYLLLDYLEDDTNWDPWKATPQALKLAKDGLILCRSCEGMSDFLQNNFELAKLYAEVMGGPLPELPGESWPKLYRMWPPSPSLVVGPRKPRYKGFWPAVFGYIQWHLPSEAVSDWVRKQLRQLRKTGILEILPNCSPDVLVFWKALRIFRNCERSVPPTGAESQMRFFDLIRLVVTDYLLWAGPAQRQLICWQLLAVKQTGVLEIIADYAPEILVKVPMTDLGQTFCVKATNAKKYMFLCRLWTRLAGAGFCDLPKVIEVFGSTEKLLIFICSEAHPSSLPAKASPISAQRLTRLGPFSEVLPMNFEKYAYLVKALGDSVPDFLMKCLAELKTQDCISKQVVIIRALLSVLHTFKLEDTFKVIFEEYVVAVSEDRNKLMAGVYLESGRQLKTILYVILELKWNAVAEEILYLLRKYELTRVFSSEYLAIRLKLISSRKPKTVRLKLLKECALEVDMGVPALLPPQGFRPLVPLLSGLVEGSTCDKQLVIRLVQSMIHYSAPGKKSFSIKELLPCLKKLLDDKQDTHRFKALYALTYGATYLKRIEEAVPPHLRK